jgi:hypothetical protein
VRASAHTELGVLGDTIPIPAGPLHNVISVGDIAMLTGLSLAVAAGMRHPAGRLRLIPAWL